MDEGYFGNSYSKKLLGILPPVCTYAYTFFYLTTRGCHGNLQLTLHNNLQGGDMMEKKEYQKPELICYEDLLNLTGGMTIS